MSYLHHQALYELMRQGLHFYVDRAEACWERGLRFELNPSIRVPGSLRALLRQCNRLLEAQE